MKTLRSRRPAAVKQIVLAVCLALLGTLTPCLAPALLAADAYYDLAITDLKFTAGQLPAGEVGAITRWNLMSSMYPRAAVDGQGEAYFYGGPNAGAFGPVNWRSGGRVVVKAPAGKDVAGRLFLPKDDLTGMIDLKFSVPASAASDKAHEQFLRGKLAHLDHWLIEQVAGGAWFRHARQDVVAELTTLGVKDIPADWTQAAVRLAALDDAYALFSGGRAVSENLQLDRVLPPNRAAGAATSAAEMVDISTITGITVSEIDWKPLVADLKPEVDPLAACIPADQHAVFLKSFKSALVLADEANREGTPVLQLADPQSQDARVLERYQRQLGISLDGGARLLGPQLIGSLALTGSDPYFRTGTDVAVLLEAKDPQALAKLLVAQVAQSLKGGPPAKAVSTQVQGVAVTGTRSADRTVSSYIAVVGPAVVVTNSLAQLERLVSVSKGKTPAIASLGEYLFFRNRYPRGDRQETALVFLSDSTIRRWCGPRWRIASARRTLAAAVLAEQQAAQLDELVSGKLAAPRKLPAIASVIDLGQLELTPTGVNSAAFGTLGFETPIVELAIDKVTADEKAGYERWRDTYQQNWRQFFDPIAIRFELESGRLAADVSVMPLILGTDYRSFVSIVQGAKIGANAGDPHDALVHWAMALNVKSDPIRQATNFAMTMAPGVKVDPFGWLGESIAVYLDDDPLWAEFAKTTGRQRDDFLTKNISRLPVAVHAEVSSGLKLTAFLATLRAFIEQTAPGMTAWESLTYKELPYVKVAPTAQAGDLGLGDKLALYYHASGEAFILTLNEAVLKRALDRQIARREAKAQGKPAPAAAWLGSSMALHLDARLFSLLNAGGSFLGNDYQSLMQTAAWSNLPILNTWKRLFPKIAPEKVHETFAHVRLVCPGGGEYVWNEAWQTMESTIYGHPGQPKSGPPLPAALEAIRAADFGLTFEEKGLRARVSLERAGGNASSQARK